MPPTITAAATGWIVAGAVVYLILLVTLGLMSIRKGHWIMFILGIPIPLFWLIGGLMPPTAARAG